MAKRWIDFLQEASFGGVVFDMVSVEDLFANGIELFQYDGRNGGPVGDHGEEHVQHQVVAVFCDDEYPEKMFELVAKIREGGVQEFVHPIWGSSKCVCKEGRLRHDSNDAIDYALLQLTFVEHTEDPAYREKTTTQARANEVRTQAEAAIASATAFSSELALDAQASPALIDAAAAAVSAAQAGITAANALEDSAGDMNVDEILVTANDVATRTNAVLAAIVDWTTPAQYALARDLTAMAEALRLFAGALIEAKPPLLEVQIDRDTPLLAFVHERFAASGDVSREELARRVDEVFAMNEIEDPLVLPAGKRVKTYAV